MDKNTKIATVFGTIWLALTGLISPFWVAGISLGIDQRSRYPAGPKIDNSEEVLGLMISIVMIVIWIIAVIPDTIYLTKRYYRVKKRFAAIPYLVFILFFAVGFLLAWIRAYSYLWSY